jgi:ABC-type polysaccharide/polyol phosphate export permease
MYLTPVIYATEFFPAKYQWIFKLNPMAVIINAYREVILAQGAPNLQSLGIALGLSVILLAITYKFFKKAEGVFADIV